MHNPRMRSWSELYASKNQPPPRPERKPCIIMCEATMPDGFTVEDGSYYVSDSVGMYHNLGKFKLDANKQTGKLELTYERTLKKLSETLRVSYTGFITMRTQVRLFPAREYTLELEDGVVENISCVGYKPEAAEFRNEKSLWPPRAR